MSTKEGEVTAHYMPTVQDAIDAFRVFYRRSTIARQDISIGIVFVVFSFSSALASFYISAISIILWVLCTCFLTLAWFYGTGLYRNALVRQSFKQTSCASISFSVTISDAGIEQETSSGRGQTYWTTCREILETEKLFVLFYKNSTYGWLPKYGFASDTDVEEARRLFRKHIETHSLITT